MEKGESRAGNRSWNQALEVMWIPITCIEFPWGFVNANVIEVSWGLNPSCEQVASLEAGTKGLREQKTMN